MTFGGCRPRDRSGTSGRRLVQKVRLWNFLVDRLAEERESLSLVGFRRDLDWHEGGCLWEVTGSPEYPTCYVSVQRLEADLQAREALADRAAWADDIETLALLAAPYRTHPDYPGGGETDG